MIQIVSKNTKVTGVAPLGSENTDNPSQGFGYIFVPLGVDRDNFVSTCFRKKRVSIIDDISGHVIHNCMISNEAFQNIKFPKGKGEKGSPVMWIRNSFMPCPMVIGTFSTIDEDIPFRQDEEFIVEKRWEGGSVYIAGSAREGNLFISVSGDNPGNVRIDASGSEGTKLDIISSGDVHIDGGKSIKLTSFDSIIAGAKDVENENISQIKLSKEESSFEASYGDDEKKTVKSVVTEDGVISKIVLGETEFNYSVSKDKFELSIFDCNIQAQDGSLTLSSGDAQLEIKGGKISFVNGGTGINEMMNTIIDIINTLAVSTPAGPSGNPLPPTLQKVKKLEELVKEFFNK